MDRFMPEICGLLGLGAAFLGHVLIRDTALVDAGWFFLLIGGMVIAAAGYTRWEVGFDAN